MEKKTFYRVCGDLTLQGLWYTYQGKFTGLIHNDFSFCKSKNLAMYFDEEVCGYLSATSTIEELYQWFTEEDIRQLQSRGWYIHEFECADYKWYPRFEHWLIKQDDAIATKRIILL